MNCSSYSSESCGNELLVSCKNNDSCGAGVCSRLSVVDMLSNVKQPTKKKSFNGVEVRLKVGYKEFYNNSKEVP